MKTPPPSSSTRNQPGHPLDPVSLVIGSIGPTSVDMLKLVGGSLPTSTNGHPRESHPRDRAFRPIRDLATMSGEQMRALDAIAASAPGLFAIVPTVPNHSTKRSAMLASDENFDNFDLALRLVSPDERQRFLRALDTALATLPDVDLGIDPGGLMIDPHGHLRLGLTEGSLQPASSHQPNATTAPQNPDWVGLKAIQDLLN